MAVKRRVKPSGLPKNLDTSLYCYVEKENASYAKKEGKKLFGSYSAYVNALIANDRGVQPKLGNWKAPGESKLLREEVKVNQPKSDEEKAKIEKKIPSGGPGTPGYHDPII